jgi:hypothetical protein
MNFHLINFPGMLVFASQKLNCEISLLEKSEQSNSEEARELFIAKSIKLKHVEFFN